MQLRPAAEPRLSYLFIEVFDLAVMRRFYCETLGLPIDFEVEGECAFLRAGEGGPRIALYAGREDTGPPASHVLVAFDVDDLEGWVHRLREAGVSVGEVQNVPAGRAIFFEDPEGNRLELHEPINRDKPGADS